MALSVTGAILILGGLASFLVFMAILTAWDRRRTETLILVGLNAQRFTLGPLATAEVAERYGISVERTHRFLENLFAEGWVMRHDDEESERYWTITDAGVERLKTMFPELRTLDA